METKQIQLDKHQHATLKRLFNVTGKNQLRPALAFLYYDPKHKRIVACNGHSMRFEPFDFGDEILYISEDEIKIASCSQFMLTIELNKELMYPRYENVIPEMTDKSAIDCIGLGSTVLLNFMKSLEKDTQIKFTFISDRHAVLIHNIDNDFIGIIMPYCIHD